MPRSGPPTYTYTLPPIYIAIPGTTITAAQHNDPLEDIAATFNTVQPIVFGGTGASNAAAALAALGGQPTSTGLTALLAAWTAASGSSAASLAFLEDSDNGTNKITVTAPAAVASDKILTLPDATDTLVGKATTDTLTNKRVTERVTTIVSSGTPTVNTDNCDAVDITAQAAAITSMTTNLSGTPTNFQKLIYRIKDNGTARAITWGASFVALGVALPTTTVISKLLTVGFIYDTTTSKWGCVASAQEA